MSPVPDDTTSPRRDVWFDSGADRCHAWLYLPAGASSAAPVPVIVMAHGLGAVKALRLSAYAERRLQKLGVSDRTAAVTIAFERGILHYQ